MVVHHNSPYSKRSPVNPGDDPADLVFFGEVF